MVMSAMAGFVGRSTHLQIIDEQVCQNLPFFNYPACVGAAFEQQVFVKEKCHAILRHAVLDQKSSDASTLRIHWANACTPHRIRMSSNGETSTFAGSSSLLGQRRRSFPCIHLIDSPWFE